MHVEADPAGIVGIVRADLCPSPLFAFTDSSSAGGGLRAVVVAGGMRRGFAWVASGRLQAVTH